MAQGSEVFNDLAMAHRETCTLHEYQRLGLCFGTLKKGGRCYNKATSPLEPLITPPWMPTCRIHQGQQKVSGSCQALLDCGFECGKLFEWKPHGFQLCYRHLGGREVCYFLEVPTEVRLRIYRFILPDRDIPARHNNSKCFMPQKKNPHRVCMEILRVNHQIHDEAASLLYGTSVFTVELQGDHWTMCNLTVHNPYSLQNIDPSVPLPHSGGHALQDYQMQLMLLEQQNKKRLLMARQEQDINNGGPSSIRTPYALNFQRPTLPSIARPRGPSEPVWRPLLATRYFDMIRFFRVEIAFPYCHAPNSATNSTHTSLSASAALESKLYEYCDHLHGLIGRLRLIQNPIAHVEVIFKFENVFTIEEEASLAAELLLKPFYRLSNVTEIEVRSITMRKMQGPVPELIPLTELISVDSTSSASGRASIKFLKSVPGDLSGSRGSHSYLQVFGAYWQLERLIDDIRKNCHYVNPRFHEFPELLHMARIARERDDLVSFGEVWEKVVNIWLDYSNDQKDFHSEMARSIKAMYNTIERDSENA